jgi:hypothetical protein
MKADVADNATTAPSPSRHPKAVTGREADGRRNSRNAKGKRSKFQMGCDYSRLLPVPSAELAGPSPPKDDLFFLEKPLKAANCLSVELRPLAFDKYTAMILGHADEPVLDPE